MVGARRSAAAAANAATTPASGRWRGPYTRGQREHGELDRVLLAVRGEQVDGRAGDDPADTARLERLLLERQVAAGRPAVQRRGRERDDDLRHAVRAGAPRAAPSWWRSAAGELGGRRPATRQRGEVVEHVGRRMPSSDVGLGAGRVEVVDLERAARRPRASARLARLPRDRSSTTSTATSSASSRSTRCDPMKPAPPTTTTFIASLPATGARRLGAAVGGRSRHLDVHHGVPGRRDGHRTTARQTGRGSRSPTTTARVGTRYPRRSPRRRRRPQRRSVPATIDARRSRPPRPPRPAAAPSRSTVGAGADRRTRRRPASRVTVAVGSTAAPAAIGGLVDRAAPTGDEVEVGLQVQLGAPGVEPVVVGGDADRRPVGDELRERLALDRHPAAGLDQVEHAGLEHVGAGVDQVRVGVAGRRLLDEAPHARRRRRTRRRRTPTDRRPG